MYTLLVASLDASPAARKDADYLCDGENDQVQINAAMNALPAAGGEIALSGGTFYLTDELEYPAKSMTIIGENVPGFQSALQATKLQFTLPAQGDCIVFAKSSIAQGLERLTIVGDGTNTRYGIYLGPSSANIICGVSVFNTADVGVRGDTGSTQNLLVRVLTRNLDRGFHFYGNANTFINCEATKDSVLGVSGDWGFRSQESGSMYVGCISEWNTNGFEVVAYGDGVTFSGCYAEQCGRGFVIDGSPKPTNIRLHGFFCYGSRTANPGGAVMVHNSIATVLEDVYVRNSVGAVSLEIKSGAERLLVRGGKFSDATAYTAEGGATYRIINAVDANDAWLDASG